MQQRTRKMHSQTIRFFHPNLPFAGYTHALNICPTHGACGNLDQPRSAIMNWKAKLVLGILTALAMSALTLTLPHNTPLQSAIMTQFPMTVGIWAIFVLL